MSACTLTPRVTAASSARCSSLTSNLNIVMSICFVAFLMATISGVRPSAGSIISCMRSSGRLLLFRFPFHACARVGVERNDLCRNTVRLHFHGQLHVERELLGFRLAKLVLD